MHHTTAQRADIGHLETSCLRVSPVKNAHRVEIAHDFAFSQHSFSQARACFDLVFLRFCSTTGVVILWLRRDR